MRGNSAILFRIVLVSLPALGGHSQTIHRLRHHLPLRQNLDQVTVRILHERQSLHPSRVRRLLKLHSQLVEPFARRVHVRYRDADVSESSLHLSSVPGTGGVGVSRVVNLPLLLLASVVPSQFDAAGRRHAVVPPSGLGGLDGGRGDGRHEVDVEFPFRELRIMNQLEPQHIAVKVQALLGILHADHGLLHDEIFRALRGRTGHVGRDVECSFRRHVELRLR
mmetsp:Transcript_16333/g.35544  ORF Transcript_16333/g.35544 Transcript_16333/m.35544 type:complete len:222 (+) Transcript_16333:182-847(+)